jgi:hypothetical protein
VRSLAEFLANMPQQQIPQAPAGFFQKGQNQFRNPNDALPPEMQQFSPMQKMVMMAKAGGSTVNAMFNPGNQIKAAGDMSLAFMNNKNRQDELLNDGVDQTVAGKDISIVGL